MYRVHLEITSKEDAPGTLSLDGKTQSLLKGLYILSGLGTPWDPQNELEDVAWDGDVWGSLLNLLPP
ncbi:hypothetical protein ILYODFUR_018286 [Ilyodon furcidens]|uniref:Uncharacterized protein n=1 Tax=Ilyodon furcidens TaxID=33524 RepID=A0ABV0TM68_9TELE